jgi:two-component sensor histidine kinase
VAEAHARGRPANRAVAAVFLLLGLVLVLVLLLASAVIWQGHRDARAALEARTVSSAYVASTHARWLIEANLQALRRVADSTARSARPLGESAGEIASAVSALPGSVMMWVFDAQGRPVFGTDPQMKPADPAGQDYFQALQAGESWVVGPLRDEPGLERKVFPIGYRIARDGVFLGAAVTMVPADLMVQFWRSLNLGPGSSVGLLREDGWLVVRSPIPDSPLNLSDYVLFTDYLKESPEGLYVSSQSPADGLARVVAYRRVTGLPLVVAVGAPVIDFWTSFRERIVDVLVVGGPVALGLVLVSLWVVRLLRKEERAHQKLAVANERNQMLLREIHHRVKNNLQAVSALVRLQPGPREAKDELMRRIQAMSMVHEHIYSSDQFDRIDLEDYVRTLVSVLRQSHTARVAVEARLDPIVVAVEQANPLGLILNEVISNAMKHGFPEDRGGRIVVTLRTEGGEGVLEVRDNGVGFDPQASRHGMGLRLVQGLAQQLGATYTFANDGGTVFTLRFPVTAPLADDTPAPEAAPDTAPAPA